MRYVFRSLSFLTVVVVRAIAMLQHQIKRIRSDEIKSVHPDKFCGGKASDVGQALIAVEDHAFVMDDDAAERGMAKGANIKCRAINT